MELIQELDFFEILVSCIEQMGKFSFRGGTEPILLNFGDIIINNNRKITTKTA